MIYFISDCHLGEDSPQNDLFWQFLSGPARDAKALYLLGDIFNVWMGDDVVTPLSTRVAKELLKIAQNGTKLYFMHGNRDFLLDKYYCNQANMELISDPICMDLGGVPTVITHGDLLCTNDISYQRFRKLARNKYLQKLFLTLPQSVRANIAYKLRQKSMQHQHKADKMSLLADNIAIQNMLDKFNATQIIYGHVHNPGFSEINGTKRWVLGDWHSDSAVILKAENNRLELVKLPTLARGTRTL